MLRDIGGAIADLFREHRPTAVVGVESRGFVLGPLVAVNLGVGFIEVRKTPTAASDNDRWLRLATPPDYRDRNLTLGVRRELLEPNDRIVFMDDWMDTGGQALGARRIIDRTGATWLGAVVIVDALENSSVRRELTVRSSLREHEL